MRRLFALLLMGGCFLNAALAMPTNPVLARVGDKAITRQDMLKYALKSPEMSVFLHIPGGADRILHNMIMEQLLVREGERRGIDRPSGKMGANDNAYAMKVRDKLIKPCKSQDDQVLRSFYGAHHSLFSTPLFVRTQRIGVPYSADDEPSIERELQHLRRGLLNGRLSFEDAVGKYSKDSLTKDRGGDLGYRAINTFPTELGGKLRKVKPGTLIGPVAQGGMLFLYRLTSRRKPVLEPYNESLVQQAYLRACREHALRSLMARLEDSWPVTILISGNKLQSVLRGH